MPHSFLNLDGRPAQEGAKRELIQEGNLGLMKAVDTFAPSSPRFVAFVVSALVVGSLSVDYLFRFCAE